MTLPMEATMIAPNRRSYLASTCILFLLVTACSSTKSFQVNRVSAYGFLKCSNSTLRTQLRYQVKQPNDSTLIATRKVGNETGTLTVNLRGMPESPVIEITPDKVPDSDRDALLKRCSEWTK
jgi:hypothetical protein